MLNFKINNIQKKITKILGNNYHINIWVLSKFPLYPTTQDKPVVYATITLCSGSTPNTPPTLGPPKIYSFCIPQTVVHLPVHLFYIIAWRKGALSLMSIRTGARMSQEVFPL